MISWITAISCDEKKKLLHSLYRGKGLGSLLIKASLHLAKSFGFQAMQFNMVLSQNEKGAEKGAVPALGIICCVWDASSLIVFSAKHC
jgi:GNAT superfamily N-acetyltransferase